MKDNSLRRASTGFTLVELLVSVAIGLFLVAVVGGVYLSSKGSFNYQDAMSRLQENSRFAMERMARDIRMAGYNGCGNLSKVANTAFKPKFTDPSENFTGPKSLPAGDNQQRHL